MLTIRWNVRLDPDQLIHPQPRRRRNSMGWDFRPTTVHAEVPRMEPDRQYGCMMDRRSPTSTMLFDTVTVVAQGLVALHAQERLDHLVSDHVVVSARGSTGAFGPCRPGAHDVGPAHAAAELCSAHDRHSPYEIGLKDLDHVRRRGVLRQCDDLLRHHIARMPAVGFSSGDAPVPSFRRMRRATTHSQIRCPAPADRFGAGCRERHCPRGGGPVRVVALRKSPTVG